MILECVPEGCVVEYGTGGYEAVEEHVEDMHRRVVETDYLESAEIATREELEGAAREVLGEGEVVKGEKSGSNVDFRYMGWEKTGQ